MTSNLNSDFNWNVPAVGDTHGSDSPPAYSEVCETTVYDAALIYIPEQHQEVLTLKNILEAGARATTGRAAQICLLCTDRTQTELEQQCSVIESVPVLFVYIGSGISRPASLHNDVICHCFEHKEKLLIPLFSNRRETVKVPLSLRNRKGFYIDRLLRGKSLHEFRGVRLFDLTIFDKYELMSLQRVFQIGPVSAPLPATKPVTSPLLRTSPQHSRRHCDFVLGEKLSERKEE